MFIRIEAMVPGNHTVNTIFAVKIDMAAVYVPPSGQKFYLLMVDTRKMKLIFEFKLWIRFLFSIDRGIDLMFDDCVLHDLEDLQILSLLQVVRAVPVETPAREAIKTQEIYSKLDHLKYRAETAAANLPSTSKGRPDVSSRSSRGNKSAGGTVQTSVNNAGGTSDESSDDDDTPECSRQLPRPDNQVGSCCGSDMGCQDADRCEKNGPNGPCTDNINPNPNTSGTNMGGDAMNEKNHEDDNQTGKNNENQLPNVRSSPQEKALDQSNVESGSQNDKNNSGPSASFDSVTDTEILTPSTHNNSDPINSQGNINPCPDGEASFQNKCVQNTHASPKNISDKPFCMGQILNDLRNEASTSQSGGTATNNSGQVISTVAEEPFDLGDKGTNLRNSRKRVRKHKSKSFIYPSCSIQSLHGPGILRKSPENARPRHIRFEIDSEKNETMTFSTETTLETTTAGLSNDDGRKYPGITDLRTLLMTALRNAANRRTVLQARENLTSGGGSKEGGNENQNVAEKEDDEDEDKEGTSQKKKGRGSNDDEAGSSDAGILRGLRNLRANKGKPSVFQKKKEGPLPPKK